MCDVRSGVAICDLRFAMFSVVTIACHLLPTALFPIHYDPESNMKTIRVPPYALGHLRVGLQPLIGAGMVTGSAADTSSPVTE